MNTLTGEVTAIVSGPTHWTSKLVTSEKRWINGVFQGEVEKPPYEREWWEVIALVDEEFSGLNKQKVFEFETLADAEKIVVGYTYNF